MIIVDTTVWVDYLRGIENSETTWFDDQLPLRRFGLTDLILCEVLQGIKDAETFAQVRQQLLGFHVFEMGGKDLAIASAENYRKLRLHGYTVRKTINCLIATFCLREQHLLLHRDRGFAPFEEVLKMGVVKTS